MIRSLASNALTLMVVALVALGGALTWAQREFVSEGPLEEGICLEVPRGASLAQVSADLNARGAVDHPMLFRLGADYAGRADQLKFGNYLIAPRSSMEDILDVITRGGQSTCGAEINLRIGVASVEAVLREVDPATAEYAEVVRFTPEADAAPPQPYAVAVDGGDLRYRVTVAEGVTSWQVVEGLRAAEFLSGAVDEVPPEGRLAPGSYEVTRGTARDELLGQMADRQARILDDLWAARAQGLPYDNPDEALIMASIIEKETGVPDERGVVASVFVNRLRAGMRLQTDPTVIYGITEGEGVLGRGIRQSELQAETPWNTYVIDGLPPTPIANPGRDSIAAALDPADTDYVYFVADGSGGHAFAETLAEHNRNVARWREIEAERGAGE